MKAASWQPISPRHGDLPGKEETRDIQRWYTWYNQIIFSVKWDEMRKPWWFAGEIEVSGMTKSGPLSQHDDDGSTLVEILYRILQDFLGSYPIGSYRILPGS